MPSDDDDTFLPSSVRGKPGRTCCSGRPKPASDVMVEWLNEDVSRYPEPAAQIFLERDAQLVAGLGETQKRIAAIATEIAVCSALTLRRRS